MIAREAKTQYVEGNWNDIVHWMEKENIITFDQSDIVPGQVDCMTVVYATQSTCETMFITFYDKHNKLLGYRAI